MSVPQEDGDSCEGQNCNGGPAKPAETGGTARKYPFRSWQIDDVETSRNTGEGDKRSKADRSKTHDYRRPSWRPPQEESEFQKLVLRSTGTRVPIFGEWLFANVPDSFVSHDRIAVPADYTLRTGDHLLIHVWGQFDFNSRVIVDRNGEILLPQVGIIRVLGIRYENLNEHIREAIRPFFRNFDLSVSLGQMRSLRVTLSGRASVPGTYTLGALSTLSNAILFSGGPAPNGSMRTIELHRDGKPIVTFDFYDMLLKGDQSKDIPLLSGDVIFIPPVGPQVAVVGSVKQPAIYEMKNAATVRQQIEDAGGLSSTADNGRALLERIDPQQPQRNVEEFALDESGQSRVLRDGDVLRIFPLSPRFKNAVTLRGHVAQPGRYPWHAGMRISDLIPSPQAIVPDDYWMEQNRLGQATVGWIADARSAGPEAARRQKGYADQGKREGATKYSTEPATGFEIEKDSLHGNEGDSRQQSEMGDMRWSGAPRPRTRMERNPAEINWEYAVVQRLDLVDLSARLLPFNLGRAIRDPASDDNVALESGDVVTIFSQQDLRVPVEKRTKFVWVEGEVQASGVYRVGPGETLREVVARAGGLTPQAYLFASDFRRVSTRQEQRERLERMANEMERDLQANTAALAGNLNTDERMAVREELQTERAAIQKLKLTQPTGRIVLDVKPGDSGVDALPRLSLEDGDRVIIPATPATVQVVGAVYNQNSFLYQSGKSLGDYLRRSGGATRVADAKRAFVIRADGSLISKQMHRSLWAGSFEALKLMPGDTIVMPDKARTNSLLHGIRDWSQVFSQFALGSAAVKVILP